MSTAATPSGYGAAEQSVLLDKVAELEAEMARMKTGQADLREENARLLAENSQLRAENAQLLESIAKQGNTVKQLQESLDKTGDAAFAAEAGVQRITNEMKELSRQLKEQDRATNQLRRELHEERQQAQQKVPAEHYQVAVRTSSPEVTPDQVAQLVKQHMGISSNYIKGVRIHHARQRDGPRPGRRTAAPQPSSSAAPPSAANQATTLYVVQFASADVAGDAVRGPLRSHLREADRHHRWSVDDWLTPEEYKQRRDLYAERDFWRDKQWATAWRRAKLVVADRTHAGPNGRLKWQDHSAARAQLASSSNST